MVNWKEIPLIAKYLHKMENNMQKIQLLFENMQICIHLNACKIKTDKDIFLG